MENRHKNRLRMIVDRYMDNCRNIGEKHMSQFLGSKGVRDDKE